MAGLQSWAFRRKLVLLHFMEALNFTLILLGSSQLDNSPVEIPHDHGPQGAGVSLEIRNSYSARLPGGMSPSHCVSEVRNFSLSRQTMERLCYKCVCCFCLPC